MIVRFVYTSQLSEQKQFFTAHLISTADSVDMTEATKNESEQVAFWKSKRPEITAYNGKLILTNRSRNGYPKQYTSITLVYGII